MYGNTIIEGEYNFVLEGHGVGMYPRERPMNDWRCRGGGGKTRTGERFLALTGQRKRTPEMGFAGNVVDNDFFREMIENSIRRKMCTVESEEVDKSLELKWVKVGHQKFPLRITRSFGIRGQIALKPLNGRWVQQMTDDRRWRAEAWTANSSTGKTIFENNLHLDIRCRGSVLLSPPPLKRQLLCGSRRLHLRKLLPWRTDTTCRSTKTGVDKEQLFNASMHRVGQSRNVSGAETTGRERYTRSWNVTEWWRMRIRIGGDNICV